MTIGYLIIFLATKMSYATNIITSTDYYKLSHPQMKDQLGIGHSYAYFEARKGATFPSTLFFGIRYYLKMIEGCAVTMESINDAERRIKRAYGPDAIFPRKEWEYIMEVHKGRLPVLIKSVMEGSYVPEGNVLFTVESTDEKCGWLVGYLETFLSKIWYPSAVATLSCEVKKVIRKHTTKTSESDPFLDYRLHDFGARGVSSGESAMIGGLAHLLNFAGTDTVQLCDIVDDLYHFKDPIASSVPATEHSIMTTFGMQGEHTIITELLRDEYYKDKILSIVCDSYNVFDTVEFICRDLHDDVLSRTGKIVIRPDSGNPVDVTLQILKIIEKYFPVSINSNGYKVLDPHIGIIYGDGLTIASIDSFLTEITKMGWCATNMVFGMGGGLLQKVTRDTQRCAYKVSACKMMGSDTWMDVYKDPITSSGSESKKSKAGRLMLRKIDEQYVTCREDDISGTHKNFLVTMFENGTVYEGCEDGDLHDFDMIRARVKHEVFGTA